ncbi:hypothetical protein LTR37_003490 [Vermiconidia calcicola]|uniref:Uncharacterized protein n=1 Tax=Vermiconidia calcicola TaxID=1690605 RepID=A0ACC3NPP7_9PEZI|nr:hypothetical protein LTR37_003490 [Vermiconidia calcicola]
MAMPAPDNRRQSGLWAQNPETGIYEKTTPQEQSPPTTSSSNGPYEYYQAPTTQSSNNAPRRTFSARAGNPIISDAFIAATQNKVGVSASNVLDKSKIKEVALATHSKIAASLHAYSGDAGTEDFARGGGHAVAVHSPGQTVPKASKLGGERESGVVTRKPVPGWSMDLHANAVPENVRATPWSPEPAASNTKSRQESSASENLVRRGSVPDRSPLQKLEGKLDDISKEEKRARLEEAEYRARQKSLGGGEQLPPPRSNTLRSEKGRAVSDGSRRTGESSSDRSYRQVSAGAPQARPPEYISTQQLKRANDGPMQQPRRANEGPTQQFRRASEALKSNSQSHATRNNAGSDTMPERQRSVRQQPPIIDNPSPYHHAPETPRSLSAAHPQPGAQPRIAREAQPYHHAPEAPTSINVAGYPHNANRMNRDGVASRDGSNRSVSGPSPSSATFPENDGLNRTASGKYKRRLRDAGFAGAATAAASAPGYESTAANTGKARYYERPSSQHDSQPSPVSPITPTSPQLGRSGSKKLQKRPPVGEEWRRRGSQDQSQRRESIDSRRGVGKQTLQADRVGADDKILPADQDPDPLPRAAVATGPNEAVAYTVPPQTTASREAKELVGFGDERVGALSRGHRGESEAAQEKHRHFGGMFHRKDEQQAPRGNVSAKPLDEWKGAKPVHLTLADLEFEHETAGKDNAWWDNQRRTSSSAAPGQYDGPYEEEAKSFRPPLFLRCGPLLRYTGVRKEGSRGEREVWRGSIMVVTKDEQSDYSSPPVLRLFAQPMDLHTPPPKHMLESGQELPPEYEDPVAGQVKISRTGRPLYVRPVHDLEGGIDLSREENNHGLYAATRTPTLGPQFSSAPDGQKSQHITFQDKSRVKGRDGEKAGRYREVRAVRLHSDRGHTFWRWSLEIELGSTQHRVAYRINKGPAMGFWVPARSASMNVMFHSCNGFSLSVDPNVFSGPDPLWRDVLNSHQARPFHVMIGGGDQIYNDAAMRDTTLFRQWLQSKNPEFKHHAEFSPEMQEELESFYFNRYAMWFSQGLFAMAGSQIPMVNLWDDHDIIDGFGSYPHHFMSTKVFAGLGAVAFKYYMLFQHQSLVAETTREEPSWVLGASPGPYIHELSRSVFLSLGPKVAFLGIDCRTERMRDEVLSQESYDVLFSRARAEIKKGETKHVIVLLGVPIAYPRLNFLENILTSRVMDPIKAMGRTGMLGGFVNKFDGGVEILDDLDDHWTAKHHKAERNWLIQELQELAAEKSVRVTILGGDVHLGAVGQFYTPKKAGVGKDRDHRYMPNVISSAIVNTPPPVMMADVLNKRNKVHHLDAETDEDLIPMFETDVDGSKRNNRCLLPRRNYCTIREFAPGSTPPPTPPPERSMTGDGGQDPYFEREGRDRRFPPGSMKRTMSLTGGPGRLIRRLSSSSRNKTRESRSNSLTGPAPNSSGRASLDTGREQRPSFLRRPTNLSERAIRTAAAKGGAPDEEGDEGAINLKGGLDITLNMEVDQNDPSGATQPYRLLVPALWYEGVPDVNTAPERRKGAGFMDRFRKKPGQDAAGEERYDDEEGDYSDDGTVTPPQSRGQPAPQLWRPAHEGPASAGAERTQQVPSYGYDGANEAPRNGGAPPRQSVEQSGTAYSRGYNLSSPPLGSAQEPRATTANNPYPSQSQRRASAPVSQKHSQQVPGPYGHAQDEYSEDSLTQSEEYDDRPPGRGPGMQPRRLSKAERFFGIGDEGGPRRGSMQDDGGYMEKEKPRWKIWK